MEDSFNSLGPNGPLGPMKLEYNNEVMKLKKYFVQAKTQIINNLVKKIKKLKSHKGTDTLKEKFDRKVESMIAEILLLKKLKYNEVAHFAMVNNEELNKVMNTPVVTQEKVMAKMTSHKALKSKLHAVKNKFNIVPVSELLEPNPKKVRQKKIKKRKALKASKENKNLSNVLEPENTDDINHSGSDENNSDASSDSEDSHKELHISNNEIRQKKRIPKVANSSNVSIVSTSDFSVAIVSEDHSEVPTKDLEFKPPSEDFEFEPSTEDFEFEPPTEDFEFEPPTKDLKFKPPSEDFEFKPPTKDLKFKPPTEDLEFKPVKMNKKDSKKSMKRQDENYSEPEKKSKTKSNKDKILVDLDNVPSDEPIQKTVDPFFVMESGDSYLTMALPRPADILDDENFSVGENRRMRRAAQFGNEKMLRPKKQKFNNSNNSAKRNFSEMSNSKYNDDGQNSSRFKKNFDKPAQSGLRDRPVLEQQIEKLHPSWEAKKQKSAIVNFQGSKIVFDD